MKTDHGWLEQWTSILRGRRVLELGCGNGTDTKMLAMSVGNLVACDLEVESLSTAHPIGSHVQYMAVDHSKSLPFSDGEFDIVVASLTLHYFKWEKTKSIVDEISRVLNSRGQLICRLNSRQDMNYGATGHLELEPGLYDVNGVSKRFFCESDIKQLFCRHWQLQALQHKTIDRYLKPKNIWEFIAINAKNEQTLIRRASYSDASEISRLIEPLVIKYILPTCSEAGGELLLNSMNTQSIEKYLSYGYEYSVAEVTGQIIAVIGIKENSHLYHLFVNDDYKGQGIAKLLWENAKEQCLKTGNAGYFTVNSALSAVSLYQNWGFIALSEVRIRSGIKDVPMRLAV